MTDTPLELADMYDEPSLNGAADDTEEVRPYGGEPLVDDVEEKRPVPTGPRTPLSDLVTMAWGGAGMALVQSGTDVPVGRVLQLQAPMAGAKIDAILAGTWLDKVLQPLAKSADAVEGVGVLIGLPLMIGLYERNPSMAPVFEPILRQLVRSTLVEMAPVLKKQRAEEKKAFKAMEDLSESGLFDGVPKDVDPVDAILQAFFAAPEGYEEEAEDGAE